MTKKSFDYSKSPLKWRWKEGLVDRAQEHIKLSYGDANVADLEQFEPVALLSPPIDYEFTVQFILNPDSPRFQEMLKDAKRELNFYLVEKQEEMPWHYAIYHCGTAANLYSLVHWSYYPRGESKRNKERKP